MANKLIVLCLLLSAFQLSKVEGFGDFFNTTLTKVIKGVEAVAKPIEQGLQKGVNDLSAIVSNSSALAAQITNNIISHATNISGLFLADFQKKVDGVIRTGRNISSCAGLVIKKAEDIVNTTTSNARTCTATALKGPLDLFGDLTNLLSQFADLLIHNVPNQATDCLRNGLFGGGILPCELNVGLNATSRAFMIGKAGAVDLLKIPGVGVDSTVKMFKCEADLVGYVVSQFAALGLNSVKCLQSGTVA